MLGAIAGDITDSVHEAAEAYFGIPAEIEHQTLLYLDEDLRRVDDQFRERFVVPRREGAK